MMGWMAPLRHRRANLVVLANHQEREHSMSEITTIGLDLVIGRKSLVVCFTTSLY